MSAHKQLLFIWSMEELAASPAGSAMGVTLLWVRLFPADNTAAVHTQRMGFNRQEQDVYLLPILVVDSGPPALSSTGTLTIRICGCDSNGAIQSCNSTAYVVSATLSPGALIALLVCILILVGECPPVPQPPPVLSHLLSIQHHPHEGRRSLWAQWRLLCHCLLAGNCSVGAGSRPLPMGDHWASPRMCPSSHTLGSTGQPAQGPWAQAGVLLPAGGWRAAGLLLTSVDRSRELLAGCRAVPAAGRACVHPSVVARGGRCGVCWECQESRR